VRTLPLAVAVGVLCVGVAVACEKSVPGTVAMTTEPGAPLTTQRTTLAMPTIPAIPGLPSFTLPMPTSPSTPTSTVPAPADALTMTCKEFGGLDEATRKAVVQAILAQQADSPFGMLGAEFAESMATTVCQFVPQSTVKEVLTGTTMTH
jgi:hypothetical protein